MSATAPNLIPKYEPGEKLLCFHGPLLYEAKCLDVKVKEDGVVYFVHYQGWNKNWDEWVTDKRIFKYNEEGLRKQKELEQQIKSGKKVKILRKSDLKKQSYPPPEIMEEIEQTLRPVENKQVSQPEPKVKVKPSDEPPSLSEQPKQPTNTTPPPEPTPISSNKPSEPPKPPLQEEHVPPASHTPVSNRRRKGRTGPHDGSIENEEGFLTAPQLKVDLPSSLKAWLVDDWDLITRQARLYELPASYPISSIMLDFLQYANTNDVKPEPSENMPAPQCKVPITSDLRHEFIAGLQHYFNQVVGSQLLYKFERLQYAELLKQHTDKRMSDIYGSIHLLRLFVKLREMVSCTRVDPSGLPILETLVNEFLEFLRVKQKTYFRLENYTVATAEYQRRAMC
ncbi:Mortality factor 4-like protein 1 [Clonorchis sinensis]|uniref:Mortality factor 4-like protein 1 n=2 Tax=Clonorchis sinensis TaxID=79923 RepID=A0A8T1MDY1_CLOSI|nr:Mortality factor 4-like protein 1 [Clonorchis sinensis]